MVDNKTAHLALPLPDLSNMQDEDVPRIGRAMSMLDAHAQKVDSALESQGREVTELKAGSQAQAGSFELLAHTLETEKAERSEADKAASIKLQELATGQNDIGQRVDTLGETSADHGTRLDAAEQGITAISTTLIGSIMSITAAEGYVPNGAVPADAAEYTREQFREFYDTYLVGGKLITCTYAAFAAQVALTGNCTKFALDKDAQKFKVPLLKDGDSITQALSASEIGKSVKAGLPDIEGEYGNNTTVNSDPPGYGVSSTGGWLGMKNSGAFYPKRTTAGGIGAALDNTRGGQTLGFKASLYNSTYGNSTTVTDEQVRLRHFVVLASAQNSASVFDWSNYMTGLAGKANLDMDNLTAAGSGKVANYAKPSQRAISMTFPGYGQWTAAAPASGWIKLVAIATASGQYVRGARDTYVFDHLVWASGASQTCIIEVPVRKGDKVFVEGNMPNGLAAQFTYDEGSF